jgi:hypothetical protein
MISPKSEPLPKTHQSPLPATPPAIPRLVSLQARKSSLPRANGIHPKTHHHPPLHTTSYHSITEHPYAPPNFVTQSFPPRPVAVKIATSSAWPNKVNRPQLRWSRRSFSSPSGSRNFKPIVFQASRGAPVVGLEDVPGIQRPGEQAEPELPVLEGELLRQHHLAIVVAADGDLMMADVARSKPDLVPPAQEREHLEEKVVDLFCSERRLVA